MALASAVPIPFATRMFRGRGRTWIATNGLSLSELTTGAAFFMSIDCVQSQPLFPAKVIEPTVKDWGMKRTLKVGCSLVQDIQLPSPYYTCLELIDVFKNQPHMCRGLGRPFFINHINHAEGITFHFEDAHSEEGIVAYPEPLIARLRREQVPLSEDKLHNELKAYVPLDKFLQNFEIVIFVSFFKV